MLLHYKTGLIRTLIDRKFKINTNAGLNKDLNKLSEIFIIVVVLILSTESWNNI